MKILLLVPAAEGDRWVDGTGHRPFAQLAMPAVAAATPPGHEIRILDEKVEPLDFAPAADLVGITVDTLVAGHAYRLARRFRERGSVVVLGGPHVSLLPREAAAHADAVVIGDAEDTWPRLLADVERGGPAKFYRSSYPPLAGMKPPRLDLLRPGAYPTLSVTHAGRGCPNGCDFCCIPGISGGRYRSRPVKEVAAEVERHGDAVSIFWDDNLAADRAYALRLFDAIRPLKKKWIGQVTTRFALDAPLAEAAASAGCIGLFLGIESFSTESLREARKGFNRTGRYREAIGILHGSGIAVDAGIVFGFDHDGREVFENTLEAAEALRFDVVNFNILTPFPGTRLYRRLRDEGRIVATDWEDFHPYRQVAFRPRRMTSRELLRGYRWATEEYYRPHRIWKRLLGSPWNFHAKRLSWFMNWNFRKIAYSFNGSGALSQKDGIREATGEARG